MHVGALAKARVVRDTVSSFFNAYQEHVAKNVNGPARFRSFVQQSWHKQCGCLPQALALPYQSDDCREASWSKEFVGFKRERL